MNLMKEHPNIKKFTGTKTFNISSIPGWILLQDINLKETGLVNKHIEKDKKDEIVVFLILWKKFFIK